jgi:hypothetical protein
MQSMKSIYRLLCRPTKSSNYSAKGRPLSITKLFHGTLGVYPHQKIHIDLVDGAVPKHARPYPVPVIHLDVLKKTTTVSRHLCFVSTRRQWMPLQHLSHPKKDGKVRWVCDLHELNKVVRRKQYPLTIIQEKLRKLKGCEFFTKLYISIQYYPCSPRSKSLSLNIE